MNHSFTNIPFILMLVYRTKILTVKFVSCRFHLYQRMAMMQRCLCRVTCIVTIIDSWKENKVNLLDHDVRNINSPISELIQCGQTIAVVVLDASHLYSC